MREDEVGKRQEPINLIAAQSSMQLMHSLHFGDTTNVTFSPRNERQSQLQKPANPLQKMEVNLQVAL